jgi:UDP:flavonoid glycosyltransferase YjiC (YdhE family)
MDVSARVHWNKVGIDLKTDRPTEKQIDDAMKEILTKSIYRENARRMGREMRSLGGAQEACNLLETLVKTQEIVKRESL